MQFLGIYIISWGIGLFVFLVSQKHARLQKTKELLGEQCFPDLEMTWTDEILSCPSSLVPFKTCLEARMDKWKQSLEIAQFVGLWIPFGWVLVCFHKQLLVG